MLTLVLFALLTPPAPPTMPQPPHATKAPAPQPRPHGTTTPLLLEIPGGHHRCPAGQVPDRSSSIACKDKGGK